MVNSNRLLPQAFRDRIAAHNHELNAYTQILAAETGPPPHGPLAGMALAVKDLIDIAGYPTSAASHVLAGNVATQDAAVIVRLREAGAVFLGKTNLHEFAYGGSGVISSFGPVRNPWNTAHITGGSSSGSAAAVAGGLCTAAIGTDTAGSIRLPASFCGIVGFKPTYGCVPTQGVIPLAESYDHVGPMTRSVEEARRLFAVMSSQAARAVAVPEKLRIGIPEQYFYADLDPQVGKTISAALQTLETSGHVVRRCAFSVEEDRTLASYESYAYHKRWVTQSPALYQAETLRRVLAGANITPAAAEEARAQLQALRAGARAIFQDIDVLLTPTVPVLPPRIDDLLGHPDSLRACELLMLRNTRPFNVLGLPAISLPWDLSAGGLPVGVQLAAAPDADFELLAIAEGIEKLAPWQGRTPPRFC